VDHLDSHPFFHVRRRIVFQVARRENAPAVDLVVVDRREASR
jgi:hypothetical protein